MQLKNSGETGEQLQTAANNSFNSQGSSFSCYDLLADIDAYNISNLYYNSKNQTIADVIKQYYMLSNLNTNNTTYIKLVFPELETTATTTELKQMIINRLNSNLLINLWCTTSGASYGSLTEQIEACANAFADHFIG